jgi:cyclophilin family peptidyl-prolyl cis-trans isomerase
VPTEKRMRQREGRQARQEELRRAQKQKQMRRRSIIGAVLVLAVIGAIILTSRGGNKKSKVSTTATTATTVAGATTTTGPPITGDTPCPNADGSSPRVVKFAKAPPTCIDASKTYTATIETDIGTMKATLDAKAAPNTVNNFVVLARYHYFDGITFHRVVPGFVLQGGDPQGTGSGGPGYQFNDELPQAGQYKVGSLAMANSGPNTNGSQFFVIVGDQGVALPPKYSLFGQVTDGIDVAHKIEADGAADPNPPKVIHKMTKVTITES